MKKKILAVMLATVLMLSMGLVMAAPVGADPRNCETQGPLYLSNSGGTGVQVYEVTLSDIDNTANLSHLITVTDLEGAHIASSPNGTKLYLCDTSSSGATNGGIGYIDLTASPITWHYYGESGIVNIHGAACASDGTLYVMSAEDDKLYTITLNEGPPSVSVSEVGLVKHADTSSFDILGADMVFANDGSLYLWTSGDAPLGLYSLTLPGTTPNDIFATYIGGDLLKVSGLAFRYSGTGDLLASSADDPDNIYVVSTSDGSDSSPYRMKLGGIDYAHSGGDMASPMASIELTKEGPTDPVHEGDVLLYEYEVHNTGGLSLDITLTDVFPGEAASPSPVMDNGYNVGDDNENGVLDPCETWLFTYEYTVPWFYDCWEIPNEAEVIGTWADGEADWEVSDTAEWLVTIERYSDIEITKIGPDYEGYFESYEPEAGLPTYTYTVTTGTGDCAIDITSIVDDVYGDLSGYYAGGDTDGDEKLSPIETWTYEVTDTLECFSDNTTVIINSVTVAGENVKGEPVDDSDCWTVILFQWQPRTIGYWGNWDNHYGDDAFDDLFAEVWRESENLRTYNTGWLGEFGDVHDFLLGKPPLKKKNTSKEAVQQFHMEKQFLATWLNVKAYMEWAGIDPPTGEPIDDWGDFAGEGRADVGMDPNAIVYLTAECLPEGAAGLFDTDALSVWELIWFIEDNKNADGGWSAEQFGIAYEVLDIMNNAGNDPYFYCAFMDPATEEDCPHLGIDLVKEADTEEAEPTDTITYTYYVENTSQVTLFNLTVSDIIQEGKADEETATVTEVDVDPSPDGYNDGDTNMDGNFDPGEIWEFTATYDVFDPFEDEDEAVDNTATASAWWYDLEATDTDFLSIPVSIPVIQCVPLGVVYGTERGGDNKGDIYEIDLDTGKASFIFETGLQTGESDYPNGNAFDQDNNRLYYSTRNGNLYFYDFTDPPSGNNLAGPITVAACAAFYNGDYYYIAQGSDNLWMVDLKADGTIASRTKVADVSGNSKSWGFGDIAIGCNGMLYGAPVGEYFVFDLNNPSTSYSDKPAATAKGLQLAFGSDGVLYGHSAGTGVFYTIVPETGMATSIGLLIEPSSTGVFTDLAGFRPCDCES